MEKIKKHPGYTKVSSADKVRVRKLLNSAFDGAMELKDKLKEKYDEERKEHIKKQQQIVSHHTPELSALALCKHTEIYTNTVSTAL